jgi:ABC-type transporter Mla subunit MlaD
VASEIILRKNQKKPLDAELSKEIVGEKQAVNSGYARTIKSFLWRLEEFSTRIAELRNDLTHRIDALQSEIHSLRNWMVGLLITIWVTIILAILMKG